MNVLCQMAEQENANVSMNKGISSSAEGELIEIVKRNFLSEPVISIDRQDPARKIFSDPNFYDNINYDDLCGPWSYPETPAQQKYDIPLSPQICTWKFINITDMRYIKQHQYDKETILLLIGSQLPNNVLFAGVNKDIFLQLMWEVFRFTRDNGYTEIAISSLLGIFYFTHRYFLTTLWRTQAEVFEFFKENVLLHSVLVSLKILTSCDIPKLLPIFFEHPPKSIEVFTLTESKQSLDLFRTLYMRQLPLVRFVCLPNYRFILTLEGNSSSDQKENGVKKGDY